MQDKIINLLSEKEYVPLSLTQIAEALDITASDDFKYFVKELVSLEEDGTLYKTKNDTFMLASSANIYKGIIRVNRKGFGFVILDDGDVFVPFKQLNDALNGDRVLVQIDASTGKNREGRVLRIIERATDFYVGTYFQKKDYGYVLVDDKNANINIDIAKKDRLTAVDGSKVCVELKNKKDERTYFGKIINVFGHRDDPGIEILATIYKHGIDVDFSNETMNYIKSIPSEVNEQELEGRVDLRSVLTVTIDGDDAKDLDDAIGLVKLEDKYILQVSIADVSYYVQENSPLDLDASDRGTSVYLVDRVIPMIPHYLSNNICSLNEQVDRLTQTCEMHIDFGGNLLSYKLYPSVINSNARMTYNNVNKILDGEILEQYESIKQMFFEMKELANIIRAKRYERGNLDFDVPEGKVIVDENGKAIDVVMRERFEAERIIEDFMILANETVATHFHWLDVPFIYRIHGQPKEQKIAQFFTAAASYGLQVKKSMNVISNHSLQQVLEQIEDDEGYVMRTLLLRSMQKAVYDTANIGHFGLASSYYTHFTSPIRRYPDLLVHRLIRKYHFEGNLNFNANDVSTLTMQAQHASLKERKAMECEFEIMDMKKAEYMEQFIGQEFEGIISSVTSFGIFVELPNTVEGLVRLSDIKDDHYIFDEARMIIVGERKAKVYKLGQHVKVILARSDKVTGEIDFSLK